MQDSSILISQVVVLLHIISRNNWLNADIMLQFVLMKIIHMMIRLTKALELLGCLSIKILQLAMLGLKKLLYVYMTLYVEIILILFMCLAICLCCYCL